MVAFLRGFFSNSILANRSTVEVMIKARRKAVELAMLNQIDEAYSIFEIIEKHSQGIVEETGHRPLNPKIPQEIQFLYEVVDTLPPGVDAAQKLNGEEELQRLEDQLHEHIPYLPDWANISRNATEEDFVRLDNWVKKELLESGDPYLNTITGHHAMRLSAGLTGLLNIALYLNKTTEADNIMALILSRIHSNSQSEYLSYIRPAWKKYYVSGWLRDKLELSEDELKQYAEFIRDVTKKRLEEGQLNPNDIYKDKSYKEMLDEINENTLRFPDRFEELWYQSDGSDNGDHGLVEDEEGADDEKDELGRPTKKPKYIAPSTILHKPATAAQIAEAESKLGHSLPDDLKDFYAHSNGTRPVISCPETMYLLNSYFIKVQDLWWDDEDWMNPYEFNMLPGIKPPVPISWPNIEGGAIAMYEHDGQGTHYLWYFQGELVAKAKKIIEEAYEKAGEADKKTLDKLVEMYHGSWEQLKNLQACWYQQGWGDPDSMIVFHHFRDFFNLVVYESRYEEDRSPFKLPEGADL